MVSENITFECNGETIAATIDWNANKDKPTIMCLHGGGSGNREKVAVFTKCFANEANISCIRFDHSGWGESSGASQQGSLKKRVEEALAASQFMDLEKPLTIMGSSMGGPMVMELTWHLNVRNAILFCPALYAVEAFDVPFGEEFAAILRSENSFLRADTKMLENYTGNFLHIIGEHDNIIPKGVTQLYEQHIVHAAKREFICIPNAGHQLYPFFAENKMEQDKIFAQMLQHIQN